MVLSLNLAWSLGTRNDTSIPKTPVIIRKTGQENASSKCSLVNLYTATAIPAKPEKKNDFIWRATLAKTNAIDAMGNSTR